METLKGKGKLAYHTIWVILECDPGIVEYYQHCFWKERHIKLARSKHGSHISLVRGKEEGIEPGFWERNLDGGELSFFYIPELVFENNYCWINVWGEELEKVRTDLGLSPKPPMNFHLTIGRVQ